MKPSPQARRIASALHEAKQAAYADGRGRNVTVDDVHVARIEIVEVRDREAERLSNEAEIYISCAFVHLTRAGANLCVIPWRAAL